MFYTVAVLGENEPGRDVACSRNDEMNFAVLRRACTSSVIEFLPRAIWQSANKPTFAVITSQKDRTTNELQARSVTRVIRIFMSRVSIAVKFPYPVPIIPKVIDIA